MARGPVVHPGGFRVPELWITAPRSSSSRASACPVVRTWSSLTATGRCRHFGRRRTRLRGRCPEVPATEGAREAYARRSGCRAWHSDAPCETNEVDPVADLADVLLRVRTHPASGVAELPAAQLKAADGRAVRLKRVRCEHDEEHEGSCGRQRSGRVTDSAVSASCAATEEDRRRCLQCAARQESRAP